MATKVTVTPKMKKQFAMFYTIFYSAGHAINDFLCGVWYMNYLGYSLKALSSSYILPVLYNFLLFKPIFLALEEELTKRNLAMKESLNIQGKKHGKGHYDVAYMT